MRWIGTCTECGRLVGRRHWLLRHRNALAGHRYIVPGTGCQGDISYCLDAPCPRDPECIAAVIRLVHDDCGLAYAFGAPTPEEERLWQEAGDMV